MITAERLREILHYEPETGVFTWREKISVKVVIGRRAGSINAAGYRVIGIGGRIYYAHRLAFLYMTGEWPPAHVDHKRDAKDDNRWSEIRAASAQQNALNMRLPSHNTSGFKGVSWHRAAGKWSAGITINGTRRHLGLFESRDEARAAYMRAASNIHSEFARAS